jgi:CO/xanthine dehydrogenase Mo-binding subunit
MLPVAPAIINAVSRAIGKRMREIPATPEKIVDLIHTQVDIQPLK